MRRRMRRGRGCSCNVDVNEDDLIGIAMALYDIHEG